MEPIIIVNLLGVFFPYGDGGEESENLVDMMTMEENRDHHHHHHQEEEGGSSSLGVAFEELLLLHYLSTYAKPGFVQFFWLQSFDFIGKKLIYPKRRDTLQECYFFSMETTRITQ